MQAPPAAIKPAKLPTTARYEFQKPLGSGGAGTVYQALDRRTDQLVAIKVLRDRPDQNPVLHRRLGIEFRAASALEHPNIVRALDAELDGPISYLVYELVPADSLGERLERYGRMTEEAAVRIVTQIGQALQYAHDRLVIHRDVKPDNILVLADGRAKLTDFGLAKDFASPEGLTQAAGGLGTPNFMAPEQFADARAANARCDVYSLAATLYNAIAGRPPFSGKTWHQMLASKEQHKFTPLSALAPDVSDRVERAVRVALMPNPADRPADCLEFVRQITCKRRSKPAATVPPPAETRRTPGPDRRSGPRYTVTVGTVALTTPDAHGTGEQERWPAVMCDLSAAGALVRLARRFEPGTELLIQLPAAGECDPGLRPARVTRVIKEKAGHWEHGCEFVTKLEKGVLNALLRAY